MNKIIRCAILLLIFCSSGCELFSGAGENDDNKTTADPTSPSGTNVNNTDYSFPNKSSDEIAKERSDRFQKFLRSSAPLKKRLEVVSKLSNERLATEYLMLNQPGDRHVYFTNNPNYEKSYSNFFKELSLIPQYIKLKDGGLSINDKFSKKIYDEYIKTINNTSISLNYKGFILELAQRSDFRTFIIQKFIRENDCTPKMSTAFKNLVISNLNDINYGLYIHDAIFSKKDEFINILIDNNQTKLTDERKNNIRRALGNGSNLNPDTITKIETLIK